MIRSIAKDVTCVGAVEKLEDFFTTPEGKKRVVKHITCENAADIVVRGYLDQDRIVEYGLEAEVMQYCFSNAFDIDVPVGRTLKAGIIDLSGTGQTLQVTVFFEETE